MLGVILIQAPRLSETFIALELMTLARRGVPLRVFALAPADHAPDSLLTAAREAPESPADAESSPEAETFTGFTLPVTAPPGQALDRAIRFARAHIALACRRPRRYVRLFERRVVRRSWIRFKSARRGGRR